MNHKLSLILQSFNARQFKAALKEIEGIEKTNALCSCAKCEKAKADNKKLLKKIAKTIEELNYE